MRRIIFAITVLLLCLSGCQSRYYSNIQAIPNEKWDVKKPLVFKVDITDSMAYYNMYIHLRNTTDFETQNFYVFMKTKYPDGHSEQDTLGFIVCDKFGKWTGKGQGRIKDNMFLFQPKIRFPRTGTYTFTVTQGMRTDKVKGISDFGITLENWKE
jgi:gliding motility-associated lipoprotein GldH